MAPYKIEMECFVLRSCLVAAGRMLPFMVEQVFLPKGGVGAVLVNAWCRYTRHSWGRRRTKDREKLLCLNFSCLAIKYEFYFTVPTWPLNLHYISRNTKLPCTLSFLLILETESSQPTEAAAPEPSAEERTTHCYGGCLLALGVSHVLPTTLPCSGKRLLNSF